MGMKGLSVLGSCWGRREQGQRNTSERKKVAGDASDSHSTLSSQTFLSGMWRSTFSSRTTRFPRKLCIYKGNYKSRLYKCLQAHEYDMMRSLESAKDSDFALFLALVLLLGLFLDLLDPDLHECPLLGLAVLLLHDDGDAAVGRGVLLLFLLGQVLLDQEVLEVRLFLLLELALLLALADVGLEVFELLLRGALAFLVIVDGLGDWLDGGIADGDQHGLVILALLLPPQLLPLLRQLLLQLADPDLVLHHLLRPPAALLLPLLVVEPVLRVEEGPAHVGLVGSHLRLHALHLLLQVIIRMGGWSS